LTTWYATAAFHPPPDEQEFQRVMMRYNDQEQWPKEQAAKDRLLAEKEQFQKEHDEAEKRFYRIMFWVTYPVGLLSVLVGLLIPVQAIGAGFMFGGIFALAAGCYEAWDMIGRWAHLWSLLIALACVVIVAFWRFGKNIVLDDSQGKGRAAVGLS
jgi:hypothetical protein